ncbi:hypothetical protein CsSME_00008819 [Camellia sinensis var. sinensis]
MADKLGREGLIEEFSNGFPLLMDGDKGVITFNSLKRNATPLGLQELKDNDLRKMLREDDFDGDGALNQIPELMKQSLFVLEKTLQQELKGFCASTITKKKHAANSLVSEQGAQKMAEGTVVLLPHHSKSMRTAANRQAAKMDCDRKVSEMASVSAKLSSFLYLNV